MDSVLESVYQLAGVSELVPETLAELFPYMIRITLCCVSVGGVFAVIGALCAMMLKWNRWID